MSTRPQPHAQLGNSQPESAGALIRLPPISFLARDHASAPHFASLVLPIRQHHPGSDSYVPNPLLTRHITLEPSLNVEAGLNDDIRSLPKPKALGLFPLHSSGEPIKTTLQVLPLLKSESEVTGIGKSPLEPLHEVSLLQSRPELQNVESHTNSHSGALVAPSNLSEINANNLLNKRGSASISRELATAESLPKKKKGKPTLDKKPIEQLIKEFYPERRHLGSIVYNPTTTWQTLQFEHLHGLQENDKQRLRDIRDGYEGRKAESFSVEVQDYIPVVPPLTDACINSLLEVKIPYRFIKSFVEDFTAGIVQQKRQLWGGAGGIYTDDSDLLNVLCHLGLFDDALDLTDCNPDWSPEDVVRPLQILKDSEDIDLLDLSVTILMYPGLKAYYGYYKNGINSRSWTNGLKHDGLSYGVFQVKWETCVLSMDERNIYKQSSSEIEEDRLYEESTIAAKGGWKFDHKVYKRLQDKKAVA